MWAWHTQARRTSAHTETRHVNNKCDTHTPGAKQNRGHSRVIRFGFCKVIRGHLRSFAAMRVIRLYVGSYKTSNTKRHTCKECIRKHTLAAQPHEKQ